MNINKLLGGLLGFRTASDFVCVTGLSPKISNVFSRQVYNRNLVLSLLINVDSSVKPHQTCSEIKTVQDFALVKARTISREGQPGTSKEVVPRWAEPRGVQ